MTKDNWIKAFRQSFCKRRGVTKMGHRTGCYCRNCMNNILNMGYGEEIEAFISQVEKDAIEKTNKKWKEGLLIGIGQLRQYLNERTRNGLIDNEEVKIWFSDLLE